MSDEPPKIDLRDGRRIVGSDYDNAGRVVLDEPVETEGNPVNPSALRKAADILGTATGEYVPTVVEVKSTEDHREGEWATTVAFVAEDDPSDVVLPCPRQAWIPEDSDQR